MASTDMKNLRLHGKSFQFRKRLPKRLAQERKQDFFIVSLGRITLAEAQLKRDRLNLELREQEVKLEQTEADILADFLSMPQPDRDAYWAHLSIQADTRAERGDPDAEEWLGRVTGQIVPIDMNLEAYQREKPVSQRQAKHRVAGIERFKRWSGAKHLSDVNRQLAGKYVSHLVSSGLSPKTVNKNLDPLSGYWRFLVRKGIVNDNPWDDQRLSGAKYNKREAWSVDEVRLLIHNAPSRLLKHCIAIGALQGLRRKEISALKVSDCVDGLVRVHDSKTESSTRTLPWHSQLKAIIDQRLADKKPSDFLIEELNACSTLDGRADSLGDRFTKYRDKLFPDRRGGGKQSPWVFHSLRHHFGDERLKLGWQKHIVDDCTGHKKEGVLLNHYYHGAHLETLRECIEAVQL